MRVAIIGAGNSGCAMAADLSLKGHDVTLVKTSRFTHLENFEWLLTNGGRMTLLEGDEAKTGTIGCVTYDFEKIRCNDVVLITIQSNFHEPLIKRLVPYLDRNQIVIFNPGYFATAYMLKHAKDKLFTIVEATSSFIDGRISKPGSLRLGFAMLEILWAFIQAARLPLLRTS